MTSSVFRLPALAGLLLLGSVALAGCATTGDSDSAAAICHAPDGTMVPLNDSRCPQAVRNALNPATPPPMSIPQSMANESYDAEYGLVPGDQGYRPLKWISPDGTTSGQIDYPKHLTSAMDVTTCPQLHVPAVAFVAVENLSFDPYIVLLNHP